MPTVQVIDYIEEKDVKKNHIYRLTDTKQGKTMRTRYVLTEINTT